MEVCVWVVKNKKGLYASPDGEFVERPLCRRFEDEGEAEAFCEDVLIEKHDIDSDSLKIKALRVISRD